jgi:hypothetical protein
MGRMSSDSHLQAREGVNRQNNLHICTTRRADGLTRRYCDVDEPGYRRKAPSTSQTRAGRKSSVLHLQAREDEWRRRVVSRRKEGRGDVGVEIIHFDGFRKYL